MLAFLRGNAALTLWVNYVPKELWCPSDLGSDRFFTQYLDVDTLLCGAAYGESKYAA
jgi:hypothetical protein